MTNPLSVRIYVVLVALSGAAVLGLSLASFPLTETWQEATVAVILAGLITVASVYPIKVAPKVTFSITTVPIFLAVLLLNPPAAILVSVTGSLVGAIVLKRDWFTSLFTFGSISAEVAVGSFIYRLLGSPLAVGAPLADSARLLGIPAVAACQFLMNTGLVSVVVSLQLKQNLWRLWLGRLRSGLAADLGLFSLGFMAALVTARWLWAMTVLVLPALIIYRAMENSTKLSAKNALLSEKLQQQLQELRQTQAQLVESAKLASLGTLAAGVAHEINNPLFAIKGRADLLLSHSEDHLKSEKALQYVQVIRKMSDRVSNVVQALLSFSRTNGDSELVVLQQAMEDSIHLAGSSSHAFPSIEVIRNYSPSPVVVRGTHSKLQQVFLNLMLNARDAMPQGGRLTLQVASTDGTALVRVSDTGTGIPPENMERIFEPFFTTKEVGRGTGLGLFIVQGIVREHKGTVKVESELGKGSTFTISLPLELAGTIPASDSSSRSLAHL